MSSDLKAKRSTFYGGTYVSLTPFLLLILRSFGLAILNIITVEGFWTVAIVGIIIGMWPYKDPVAYFGETCRGTASNLLTTVIFRWLWSATVAGILKASGLVDGLIQPGLNVCLTGGLFIGLTFILVNMCSIVTGTDGGTVAVMTVLLYPAGVALGASLFWMTTVITSGGGFGDNLMLTSDITTTAATTTGVDVPGLVKNRTPCTIIAGSITLATVIGGGLLFSGVVEISEGAYQGTIAQASPESLIMLISAALIVFSAIKGKTLIEAPTYGRIIAIILNLATGLFDWNLLVVTDTVNGTVGRAITDAISGWYGMIVLIFLAFALAHIIQVFGALTALLEKIERKFVEAKVGAEIVCWCCIAVSALGLCNNITSQTVTGSIMLKTVNKYCPSHYKIANFSDAVRTAFSYTVPWSGPALAFYATSIVANSVYGWCPVVTPPAFLALGGVYGIIIGLVYLICAITGVDREHDQKVEIQCLECTGERFMTQEQPTRSQSCQS